MNRRLSEGVDLLIKNDVTLEIELSGSYYQLRFTTFRSSLLRAVVHWGRGNITKIRAIFGIVGFLVATCYSLNGGCAAIASSIDRPGMSSVVSQVTPQEDFINLAKDVLTGNIDGHYSDGVFIQWVLNPKAALEMGLLVIQADPAFDPSAFEARWAYPALRHSDTGLQYYACRYFVRKACILGNIGVIPMEVDAAMNYYPSDRGPTALAKWMAGPRAILIAEMTLEFAKEPRLLTMLGQLCRAIAPGGDMGSLSEERQVAVSLAVASTSAMLGYELEPLFARYGVPVQLVLPEVSDMTPLPTARLRRSIYDAVLASYGYHLNFDLTTGTYEAVYNPHWTAFNRWQKVIGYLWPYVEKLWPDYVDYDLRALGVQD